MDGKGKQLYASAKTIATHRASNDTCLLAACSSGGGALHTGKYGGALALLSTFAKIRGCHLELGFCELAITANYHW